MTDKRKDIAKILEENCHYSPQVGALVIHGAIDKIIEYFTPSPISGSLEEAAEKYADEWAAKLEFKKGSHEYSVCISDFKAGFVAGEKHQSKIEINNGNEIYRSASEYADNQSYLDGVGVWEKVRDAYAAGLASRPSLDIDKVVDELRKANPFNNPAYNDMYKQGYLNACNKLSELLNTKHDIQG